MILYFRKTIKKYKLEAPAATDVDGRIDADPPKYVGSNFTTSSSSRNFYKVSWISLEAAAADVVWPFKKCMPCRAKSFLAKANHH